MNPSDILFAIYFSGVVLSLLIMSLTGKYMHGLLTFTLGCILTCMYSIHTLLS